MLSVTYINLFSNKEHELLTDQAYYEYFSGLEHIQILKVEVVF